MKKKIERVGRGVFSRALRGLQYCVNVTRFSDENPTAIQANVASAESNDLITTQTRRFH